ncbi:MAG: hypothetical protein KJO07_13615, partial [Deltaproteobacteria bacterium]|nr:hypothetical protein [Deltaproteobacteria bacterium]
MRMQLASIAIAVAAVCPRLAAADIDVERQRARVHLQHGAVIVDAELVLRNRSRSAAALDWTVSLPDQSTVTELRVRRAGRWQKAEVLPEKQARKRYDASITIASKLGHLGPLIAEWGDDSSFSLALWPVPARRSVAIRYRATSYPCIYAGHLAVEMPDGSGALEVQGGRQLKSKSKLHTELVDNCSDIDGHGPVVAFRLPGRGLQASWANRKLSERSIADLRLLAGTLSRQPVGASVVFVLDGSYSQGEAGIRTQIARVRDFAAELPSGRYQL